MTTAWAFVRDGDATMISYYVQGRTTGQSHLNVTNNVKRDEDGRNVALQVFLSIRWTASLK